LLGGNFRRTGESHGQAVARRPGFAPLAVPTSSDLERLAVDAASRAWSLAKFQVHQGLRRHLDSANHNGCPFQWLAFVGRHFPLGRLATAGFRQYFNG